MFSRFFILSSLLVNASSFAKITLYTNENVVSHLLATEALAKFKASDETLNGLDLVRLSVRRKGPEALGATYDLQLTYGHGSTGPSLPTVCNFTARIVNQKVNGPVGITSSQLSNPAFSAVSCAH